MFPRYYLGKVCDNKDPDGLNRIRVTKNEEEEVSTEWIPVLTQFAGPDSGLAMTPDIDDQVLVVTLDYQNNRKIVLGSLWNENAIPPVTDENTAADLNDNGKNSLHYIKSRSGNMLIFDDSGDAEKIQIITSDKKTRFEFDVKEELISLTTESNITIGAKGLINITAEEISVTSKKKLNVSAEELQIAGKKKMDITASQDLSLKGSAIALN